MTAHFGSLSPIFRVSTDKQGRSGLGLEAQREALAFLNGGKWTLVPCAARDCAPTASNLRGETVQPLGKFRFNSAPRRNRRSWTRAVSWPRLSLSRPPISALRRGFDRSCPALVWRSAEPCRQPRTR